MEALLQHINMFAEELQSGELSLVLSVSSLSYLNEIIKAPMENNSILNKSNSICDSLEMKKTIECLKCLRLCPSNNKIDELDALNLSQFPSLNYLGIKRLNVEEIILDPATLTTLQEIKFHFARNAVKEILKTIKHSDMCSCLTILDLQYNKLETWGPELINSMPALCHLNLSNNRLTTIDISETPKLRSLYASFNLLQNIPCMSINEVSALKTLHLNNNLISDDGINDLKYLDNLKEITLDNNLLKDYYCLSELSDLPELNSLSLQGNPLSASKNYRLSCVKYLHENACVNLFLLDGKKLTKEEKYVVGSIVSLTTLARYPHFDRSMDQSFEFLVPSASRSRLPKKTRDALISENIVEKAPRKNIVKPELPKKHLETKVQIESIRDKFGEENWLHQQAGSVIQSLMGLQFEPEETTNTETRSNSSVSIFASSPNPTSALLTDDLREKILISDSEDSFESSKNRESDEYILPDTMINDNKSNEIFKDVTQSSANAEIDDTEGTHYIFTATKEPDNKDVFLIYNNILFKEKDSLNTEKMIVWHVKNLTSCSQLNSDGSFTRVLVTFNSYKPSQTERIYSMENTEGSLLCSLIREELESRSLSALNQTAYQCIKCSTIFSVEKNNNNKYQRVSCQACGSNAVLEMEESPFPRNDNESNDFIKSPSQSSIGSANSLKTVQDTILHRRNDSDIEVISNPSQSSVEILEVLTRKKSSEERQLVAVPEHNISNQGLTESSSSGSLTDSICTAYDGSRRRTIVHDDSGGTVLEEEEEIEANLQLSLSDFSQMDHRVKLHLLTVHFKNNEDLVCVLKCHTMTCDQEEESQSKLIVFSTCSMYIFRIIANSSSDIIESWLKLEHRYNITHVDKITVLPYQLGFHVNVVNSSQHFKNFFILLLDSKQAVNFMKYVAEENSYFKCWKLEVQVAAMEMLISKSIVKSLNEASDSCSIFLVPVLHCFAIDENVPHMTSSKQMVAVIITESIISLKYKFCESLLNFTTNSTGSTLKMDMSSPISSLLNMDIERRRADHVGCFFTTVMFDAEEEGSMKQIWKIGFTTNDELADFTELVQHSWEKHFGLQFPNISYTDDKHTSRLM